ncbi:MAG: hypothetical protein PHX21_03940 [bacterium]|nr:hypothetical protein [bacterium]
MIEAEKNNPEPLVKLVGTVSPNGIQEKVDALDFLARQKRCVILGEAGIGKTTLAKQYEIELRNNKILLLKLANYEPQTGINGLLFKTKGINLNELLTESNQELVFFLDGLNEIGLPNYKAACIKEIRDLINTYPEYPIFITCRTYDYENYFPDIPILILQTLNKKQIENLLLSVDSKFVIDFLSKFGGAVDLLTTPLYVRFFIELYYAQGKLPDNRRELMDQIVTLRLSKMIRNNSLAGDIPFFLYEIAFCLRDNSYVVADVSFVQEKLFQFFDSRGGKSILGYDKEVLWKGLIDSMMIIEEKQKIMFVHETWQEYFASVKLAQLLKTGLDNDRFLRDAWWHDCILYVFPYLEENEVRSILLKASNYGNRELIIGYALRKEAGVTANNIARKMVELMLESQEEQYRIRGVKLLELAGVEAWSIRKLLHIMSDEQEKRLPIWESESFFDKMGGGWGMGIEHEAGRILSNIAWYFQLPRDVVDVILDTKDLFPLARAEATKLLHGAIGVLSEEQLINVLEKQAKDPRWIVKSSVVDVLECLIREIQNEKIKDKVIKILEALSENPYLIVGERAGVILFRIGHWHPDDGWLDKEVEKIITDAKKAIQNKDYEFGYYLVSRRFEPFEPISDANCEAWNKLTIDELRCLLRLTIDNIIDNCEKIELVKEELEKTDNLEKRREILDMYPQISWDISPIVNVFSDIANEDDLKRFNKLLRNPPCNKSFPQDQARTVSAAVEGIVKIGTHKCKEIFLDVATNEKKLLSVVYAGLGLYLGFYDNKWQEIPEIYNLLAQRLLDSIPYEALNILKEISIGYSFKNRDFLLDSFYRKLGVNNIRTMALKVLDKTPKLGLEFLQKFSKAEDIPKIREILCNPEKYSIYELAKKTLKIIEPETLGKNVPYEKELREEVEASIKQIEMKLRCLIRVNYERYWKYNWEEQVRKNLSKETLDKADERIKKEAQIAPSDVTILDYIDFGDHLILINKEWTLFEKSLKCRKNFNKQMEIIIPIRHPVVAHHRPVETTRLEKAKSSCEEILALLK